ncbi:MAG: thiamine-phosphate kinase [Chloroflexi bacterium]|nr:thiamine-phosphate kinase [Chloroflexota bacterium]MBI2979372.1 thiamine-phosphate kinase [Chloroflexota bacterium]
MKVSELGELGLIELLAKMVDGARDNKQKAWQQLILGIGDDTAAWHGDASIQLATVDSLKQDVHFSLDIISWQDLGWKALAINLSDIAAMGGLPRYALVSLALPGSTEVESVLAIYRGIIELARQFGVAIIGGDTDRAPLIDITITVIGTTGTRAKRLLIRSAAKPGDKVAVTGYLGAAAAGLEMLTKHLGFDSEAIAVLRKAFWQPSPRINEGQMLVEHGVKAAIDISDGLVSDLKHICQASQVGARIEVDRLPVLPAVRANFGARAWELALSGGEDYELLFTAGADVIDEVKAAAACPVTVIGEITAGKKSEVTVVDGKGKLVSLPKTGWEHFASK